MDDHRAKIVAIMGAAAGALVGGNGYDRLLVAIAIHVLVSDFRVHGVAVDVNPIAFGLVIVGDDVGSKAIDPVIVRIVVFARHVGPVDPAIGIRVLGDNVRFRADLRLDNKSIGPFAAHSDVVANNRLVRENRSGVRVDLIVPARIGVVVLGDDGFTAIGVQNDGIVTLTADQKVGATVAVENVIARAAIDAVVAVAAIDHIGTVEAVDGVVAVIAKNHIIVRHENSSLSLMSVLPSGARVACIARSQDRGCAAVPSTARW